MSRSDLEQPNLISHDAGAPACVRNLAPSGATVIDYDRQQLALYAELLDANDAGQNWQDAARTVLRIDVTASHAEACWRSHLERARWIVGDGLATAMVAFGARDERIS